MNTQQTSKIVLHPFNGNEEEVKFVEVDGAKFVADETDPTKPKLGDDQKPVPYVEKKADDVVVPKIEDVSTAELEDLAKHNPKLAALLDTQKKREADDKKAADEKVAAEEKAASEKGEWQGLAEKRGTDLTKMTAERDQKEEQLGKYVKTTEAVLKGLLASIPKENVGLIPSEFSPRQKLEYIIANSSRLGAKMNAAGGKIETSDEHPAGGEEEKLIARITELTKKATDRTATSIELAELRQAGIKLTDIRSKKEAEKK